MQIIQKTTDFQLNTETAVAMGKFDGIHVGHRRLLEEILGKKIQGLKTCVFTFDPAPSFLFGQAEGGELSTREEKRILFKKMGIDILVEFPMTLETAAILPEEFVEEYLCRRLHARFIAAGRDVSFGRYGAGNRELLEKMQAQAGYELCLIDKVCAEGAEVSSTRIRSLVEAGSMEQTAFLLGEPYCIRGTVQNGQKIGRTLGFPTVNICPEGNKLLPRKGVYFTRVRIGDGRRTEYAAISNVGCKPTVSEGLVSGVESYLYDFNEEIYGSNIEVSFLAFLRPEVRFDGLECLKKQLREDVVQGEKWHQMHTQGKIM